MFFGETIAEFYRILIDLIRKDDRFSLLVKSKKSQVFEKLRDIRGELEALQSQGKCRLFDWKETVISVATLADVAICLPSTAAFESLVCGTRTLVYNPMRTGSRIFYERIGLNRRIFEEAGRMTVALRRFADGLEPDLGDCRDLRRRIDPFGDGLGPQRVGEFINWCLEGYDLRQSRQEILGRAKERYKEAWGNLSCAEMTDVRNQTSENPA